MGELVAWGIGEAMLVPFTQCSDWRLLLLATTTNPPNKDITCMISERRIQASGELVWAGQSFDPSVVACCAARLKSRWTPNKHFWFQQHTHTHTHTSRKLANDRAKVTPAARGRGGMEQFWAVPATTSQTEPRTTPSSPSLPPLLRLPPSIRHRIYRFVGLAPWDARAAPLFDLHGRKTSEWAPKPTIFHGLLLSCRVIYAEAAALLYSANRFILHYDHAHPEPLRPLHALAASSVASLTRLSIVLNQASCHHPYEYGGDQLCCLQASPIDGGYGAYRCKADHTNLHHPPLLSQAFDIDRGDSLAAAETVLGKWHSAAACLSFVTSGRLELALVCDIDPRHKAALDIAMSATAPLRLIPRLKDCCIRLCKTPDPRLGLIAQKSVFQARGIPPPPYLKPSTRATLTSLPRELRLRILEYTDLIVPTREIVWSRREQGYMTSSLDSTTFRDCRYRRQFFDCWQTDTDGSFIGCFCRRRHAAFSFTCKCWAPPGPALFLICRTLLQDAQLVFFSSNRFVIHDYRSNPPWALPTARRNHRRGCVSPYL